MYKINIFLKIFILLLSVVIAIISNNYIVLWFLISILFLINLLCNNKKQLLINFLLTIIITISNRFYIFLLIFKIIFIFNVIYTFYDTLLTKEKYFFIEKNTKNKFFEKNYNFFYNKNKKIIINKYYKISNLNFVTIKDLQRHYLQSRIRFNGYFYNYNNFYWDRIDTLILLFSIILFIIFLLIGR